MASNPSLADLKALAAALPPTERISGAEVADVLSALVATVTHGKAILDAGKEGGNAVYAFLHEEIAKLAEQNGDPQPEKGAALTQPAQPGPVAAPAAPSIDYDALAAAMVRAQAAQAQAPAEPATETSSTEGVTPSDTGTSETTSNEGGIL